jgi:hypothetical protein
MATRRTLIEPHKDDKRYIRRDEQGQFIEKQVDVGKSGGRPPASFQDR